MQKQTKKNQIFFSHDYEKLPKLWENSDAILISVCEIDKNILDNNPSFKDYDTKFRDLEGQYILNFQLGITLLFYHPESNMVFTTIRKYSNEKFRYYYDLIGEPFVLKKWKY